MSGVEQTPFVLPHRWTFETLKTSIEQYVNSHLGIQSKVAQIYYKKSGRSRAIIPIRSDKDIPALLNEYPLTCAGSGRRSRKCLMVLAVDLDSIKTDPIDKDLQVTPDPKAQGEQASNIERLHYVHEK